MSHPLRLPGLEPAEWSPEVRSLLLGTLGPVAEMEAMSETDERRPLAILAVLAHAGELLGPFLGWASALALGGTLPRRDHELLALRAAVGCHSDFEWGHHVAYARAVGLADDEIQRVVAGPDADGWSDVDAALLRAVDELIRDHAIGDNTWRVLAAQYDRAQLVEIPLVVGQYTMLSMLANSAEVPLEPGFEPLPS